MVLAHPSNETQHVRKGAAGVRMSPQGKVTEADVVVGGDVCGGDACVQCLGGGAEVYVFDDLEGEGEVAEEHVYAQEAD